MSRQYTGNSAASSGRPREWLDLKTPVTANHDPSTSPSPPRTGPSASWCADRQDTAIRRLPAWRAMNTESHSNTERNTGHIAAPCDKRSQWPSSERLSCPAIAVGCSASWCPCCVSPRLAQSNPAEPDWFLAVVSGNRAGRHHLRGGHGPRRAESARCSWTPTFRAAPLPGSATHWSTSPSTNGFQIGTDSRVDPLRGADAHWATDLEM